MKLDCKMYLDRNLSKIFVFVFFLVSMCFVGCGDDEESIEEGGLCLVEINGVFVEMELDEYPEYLNGGEEGFSEDVGTKLKYPAEAREEGIEGTCILNYEITEEGKVENVVAIQDPGGGIGDATISTLIEVSEGISFKPGVLNGNFVRVKKELSIKFKLEG